MAYLQTRGADNRDAMKKHKKSVHMSWLPLSIRSKNKNPPKPWTMNQFNISSISSQPSHCLKTFSPANPRPRPRPYLLFASTAALASRSHWTINSWPFEAAQCSGVVPREPRPPKPAGRTQGNQGGKSFEKNLAPQKSKFWKLWPLKNLHGLKEHGGFEMSWGYRVVWKTWCLWHCSQDGLDKLKHTPTISNSRT